MERHEIPIFEAEPNIEWVPVYHQSYKTKLEAEHALEVHFDSYKYKVQSEEVIASKAFGDGFRRVDPVFHEFSAFDEEKYASFVAKRKRKIDDNLLARAKETFTEEELKRLCSLTNSTN